MITKRAQAGLKEVSSLFHCRWFVKGRTDISKTVQSSLQTELPPRWLSGERSLPRAWAWEPEWEEEQTPASLFSELHNARACVRTHIHTCHVHTHTHPCSQELLMGRGEGIEQESRELRVSHVWFPQSQTLILRWCLQKWFPFSERKNWIACVSVWLPADLCWLAGGLELPRKK